MALQFGELTAVVDNSPGGDAAVRYAAFLARRLNPISPHLRLAALVQPEPLELEASPADSSVLPAFNTGPRITGGNLASEAALSERRDLLDSWSDKLYKEQVVCEEEVVVDDPVPALVSLFKSSELTVASAQSKITRAPKTPKFLAASCLAAGKPLLVVQNAYDVICHVACVLNWSQADHIGEALAALRNLARECHRPARVTCLLMDRGGRREGLLAKAEEWRALWPQVDVVPATDPKDLSNLMRQAAQIEADLLVMPTSLVNGLFSFSRIGILARLISEATKPLLLLP